jgi:hypothetical protein
VFIYSEWEKICLEISQKHRTLRVCDILLETKKDDWLVIKHDVETNVVKALALAKIEARYGIKATYYVQADLVYHNASLLQEIKNMGHEIAYHYDVLDANGGDLEKAMGEFASNLELFKKYGFEVKTVCPHGNPVMIREGWNSNKDFFRDEKVQQRFNNILDMVVQLPNKLNYTYTYISDAGYSFKKIANISNNDIHNKGDVELGSRDELLNLLRQSHHTILSTHPHRWEKNGIKFLFNVYFFKVLRSVARTITKVPFLKKILSKYYFLAKKI